MEPLRGSPLDPRGPVRNADTVRLGPNGPLRMPSNRQLPRLSPPITPPDSAKSTERLMRAHESPRSFSSVETPKVKWVPHTHPNPKHAKFCYMCLHGALEGKEEPVVSLEDDLPSALEMRNRGYLHPKQFARLSADFEKNNLVAVWLRDMIKENYERCKDMVMEMNEQIEKESHGTGYGTSYLEYEEEEARDWQFVEKLFQLTAAEQRELEVQKEIVVNWCSNAPIERAHHPEIPILPALDFEVPSVIQNLRYEPVLDLRDLPFETRDLMAEMESRSTGSNFLPTIPRPRSLRHLGELKLLHELKGLESLPRYPEVVMPPQERPIIQAIGDPISKPFFYIHTFEEKDMPEFTVEVGIMENLPPTLCDRALLKEQLHPAVQPTTFPMVPLLDHPYWPPVKMISEGVGPAVRKKVITRGIWGPELVSGSGRNMPPIIDRVKALKFDLQFEHVDAQQAAEMYVELKGSAEIVEELIPIIAVKSMARFPAKPLSVEFPDFLKMLVQVDWTNQSVFDVINQRHDVVLKEAKRAETDRVEHELRHARTVGLLENPANDNDSIESSAATVAPAVTTQPAGIIAIEEDHHAPSAPVEVAPLSVAGAPRELAPPSAAGAPSEIAPLSVSSAPGEEAPLLAGGAPADLAPPSGRFGVLELAPDTAEVSQASAEVATAAAAPGELAPASLSGVGAQLAISAASLLPDEFPTTGGSTRGALAAHQHRLQALLENERRDMQIERLLTQDAFISRLAAKIEERMDIAKHVPDTIRRGAQEWNSGAEYVRPSGDLAEHYTASGSAMTELATPWPMTFADDAEVGTQRGVSTLPVALRGESPVAPRLKDGADAPPADLLKNVTMEKSRGECYVRLLTSVDVDGAKKDIVPLFPQVQEPDESLILQQQFLLREPTAPDDDTFDEVEPSAVVLLSFVRHNRYDAVQQLLEQDSHLIHAMDDNLNTLLHVACQNNHRRVVKLLLKHGISVDDQNSNGNTALHYCYAYQFLPMVEMLLLAGADPGVKNKAGLVPSMGIGQADTTDE